MFESKKRFKELEKRIADLERQVQGQQNVEVKIDDKELCSKIGKSVLSINADSITLQVQKNLKESTSYVDKDGILMRMCGKSPFAM